MPNVFALIGTSWDFYKSQPVLNAVLFWLLALPMTGMAFLADFQANHPYFGADMWMKILTRQQSPALLLATVLLHIALILLLLWGVACCTLVGKRLLQSRAGRARTSFKAVSKQARRYVLTLLLTDVLRGCFTFFWALLLIVPGVIYQVRTFFYFVTIVCEGKGYRDSLQHSKKVVTGHTWTVLWYILGLSLAIFLPLIVADTLIVELVYRFDSRLLMATYLLSSVLYGVGVVLFLLSSISLYAQLKKMPQKA